MGIDAQQRVALDSFAINQRNLKSSIEKLSSGKSVSRPDQDPSSWLQSVRYTSKTLGIEQGLTNLQLGNLMIQTAEEGHNKITEVLQRMRTLAVRGADDGVSDTERRQIQQEIEDLRKEINNQVDKITYNGMTLLDGSFTPSLQYQPSQVEVVQNATLSTGKKFIDPDNLPVVTDNAVSASYRFLSVANDTGGVDLQVFYSRSRNPDEAVYTIEGVDESQVTQTFGPMEKSFLNTGNAPADVAVTYDWKKGYVANFSDNTVSVIDLTTNGDSYITLKTIAMGAGSHPFRIEMDPDGNFAYVLNAGSGGLSSLSRINLSTDSVSNTINLGNNAKNMAITPDGNKAFITNFSDNTVSVVDLQTFTVTDTVSVDGRPYGIASDATGANVYVTSMYGGKVVKIDTSTLATTDIALDNLAPAGIAITPDGTRAYVGSRYTGDLQTPSTKLAVINLQTGDVGYVEAGPSPSEVAVSPDGKYVYASNINDGMVTVLKTEDNSIFSVMPGQYHPLSPVFYNDGKNLITPNADFRRIISVTNPVVYDVLASEEAPYGVYDIKVVRQGTYSQSTSSQPVSGYYNLDLNATLPNAGFALTPDTGGMIQIETSMGTYGFRWSTSDTVQQVLDKINDNTVGITASYNTARNILNINSLGNVTLRELTDNGGNGFFAVNRIDASTVGTQYSGAVSSATYVTQGIITSNPIASAGFASAPDSGGLIKISNSNGVTKTFSWTNATTVDALLTAINNPANALGISLQYDPTNNSLHIYKDPAMTSFTLAEITNNGGPGFFAVNNISATATGTTYSASTQSVLDVVPGINRAVSLGAAGYSLSLDTGGVIMMGDNTKAMAYKWDPATSSTNDLINAINSTYGADTARYDLTNNRLTISRPNFTLYEVTDTGANGFFDVNYIPVITTGMDVAMSTSGTVTHAMGINPLMPIATAGYDDIGFADTGGALMMSDGTKVLAYTWHPNTTVVQDILNAINNTFGVGTAQYDALNRFLTITNPNFTLYEVTDNGDLGFFGLNNIAVATNNPVAMANAASTGPVSAPAPSLISTNPISTAGYFLPPDSGGSFAISTRNISTGTLKTQTFTYIAGATTVDQLLNSINTANLGVTASYNAAKNIFQLTPAANTIYTYHDISSGPANNDWFAINYLPTSTRYNSTQSSSQAVSQALDLTATLANAGFYNKVNATSGQIRIHNDTDGTDEYVNWDSTTVLGNLMQTLEATDAISDAYFFQSGGNMYLYLDLSGNDRYTFTETNGGGSTGFLDATYIPQGVQVRYDTESTQAVADAVPGVDTTRSIAQAGFILQADTEGRLSFSVRNDSTGAINNYSYQWRNTDNLGTTINNLNALGMGITFAYNPSRLSLSMTPAAGRTFTYSEITKNGGNGFMDINFLPTSQKYNTALESSVFVTTGRRGIDLDAPLVSANYLEAFDPTGSIIVKRANDTFSMNWDRDLTTTQDVLDFFNSIGITAGYDADNEYLSLNGNGQNFQLWEVSNGPNSGFFEANNIVINATTGTSFAGSATSSDPVAGTFDPDRPIGGTGYGLTPDQGGIITVRRNNQTYTMRWDAATTTTNDVLNWLTGIGVTASYDPGYNTLTLNGGGPFTLYEVTDRGGNGFFVVNGINVTTTGTSYIGSVTSSQAVTTPPGIIFGNAVNANNYALSPGAGGLIRLTNSDGTVRDVSWMATDTVQDVLDALNAETPFTKLSFSYDVGHSKLIITKDPSITSYSLIEITYDGGRGFFDINRINAGATGTTYTNDAVSSAPVTPGINLAGTISGSNRYAITPDTGGAIQITTAVGTKNFYWDNSTTVGGLMTEINTSGLGVILSYDATNHILTVNPGAGGSMTLAEITNTGGPGFFDINRIDASASGTTYSGLVSSSQPVTEYTDAFYNVASKPITDFSYEDVPGHTIKVEAGDISVNGVTISILATDTLKDVVDKINAGTGDPYSDTGHHVRAYYTEGTPAVGDAYFYLKSTVWGEAIDLADPGNTHFWDAMHVTSDMSGQTLQYVINGVTGETGVPINGWGVGEEIVPGVQLNFRHNGDYGYGPEFFTDPMAGLYNGPLNSSSVLTIRMGEVGPSGLSIANNGFMTVNFNQFSTEDVGHEAYVKTYEPRNAVTRDDSLQFQVHCDEGEVLRVGIPDMAAATLFGSNYHPTVATKLQAQDLISQVDFALDYVTKSNLHLGHKVNEMVRWEDYARKHYFGLTEANSLLTDTNFPEETARLTRAELIAQAASSMIAQANADSKTVLNILTSSIG
jgi:YVTN family beta-propeller protein